MRRILFLLILATSLWAHHVFSFNLNVIILSERKTGDTMENVILLIKETGKWGIFSQETGNIKLNDENATQKAYELVSSQTNGFLAENKFEGAGALVDYMNNEAYAFLNLQPFIPGSDLYKNARTNIIDDFVWISVTNFISDQPLMHPSKGIIVMDKRLRNNTINAFCQAILLSKPTENTWISYFPPPCAIYFYKSTEPYYEFANFWSAPINIDGKAWPTTEHYFQAQKFPKNPALQEQIRMAPSARNAQKIAADNRATVREDWLKGASIEAMLTAIRAKFSQHKNLGDILLDTGDRIIVEDTAQRDKTTSWPDPFWGAGDDYKGQNQLGQILMHVRDELKSGEQKSYVGQTSSADFYRTMIEPKYQEPKEAKPQPAPLSTQELVTYLQQLSIELSALEKLV